MLCRCTEPAIWTSPPLCKSHFLSHFERRVAQTIKKFQLLKKSDHVCVAASGGKDSLTTLYILKKLGYDVTALAIDEGIDGYREHTLKDLRHFCTTNEIKLTILSFKKEFGKDLDYFVKEKKVHPCSVCGTFRRYLLNKGAKGFDVIATGHNADDEAQAVLMNLCRANLDLLPRGGPRTTSNGKGFVSRVKPLYFCTEKEVLTYAFLRGLASDLTECPYAHLSYRAQVRDELNEYERKHPGAKIRLLNSYLAIKERLGAQTSTTQPCSLCGEPSQNGVCKACRMVEELVSK